MPFPGRRIAALASGALYGMVLCLAWSGGLAAAPRATSASRPPPSAIAAWRREVSTKVSRLKIFPRAALGQNGTVRVSFAIDHQGNVVALRLARSSGLAALDQAALAMVLLASPLPPPPAGADDHDVFIVPMRFQSHW